jgi:hypothetical protein
VERNDVLAGDRDFGRGVFGFELGVLGFGVFGAFPLLADGVFGFELGVFGTPGVLGFAVLGLAVSARGLNVSNCL